MIHTVKGFSIVNEAEVGVFLEFSCFSYYSVDVGNLISGSSAFSKSSLNIWKFMVHVPLKSGLEIFEHYFASMCVCVCLLVTQSCLTLCDPMNHSPPEFSIHGILQARILDWIAIPFSRGSSWPRDRTLVSCITGRFFTTLATGKP